MTVAMRGDGDPATIGGDALVVTAFKRELGPAAAAVDGALDGELSAMLASGEITGRFGEVTVLTAPAGVAARRLVVLGLGERSALDSFRLHNALHAGGSRAAPPPPDPAGARRRRLARRERGARHWPRCCARW